MIRVKDANGTEALVTQQAFDQVWKAKGFTLVNDDPVEEDQPKAKPKKGSK